MGAWPLTLSMLTLASLIAKKAAYRRAERNSSSMNRLFSEVPRPWLIHIIYSYCLHSVFSLLSFCCLFLNGDFRTAFTGVPTSDLGQTTGTTAPPVGGGLTLQAPPLPSMGEEEHYIQLKTLKHTYYCQYNF